MVGSTGVPLLARQRGRHPQQRRRVLSGDARGDPRRRALDHDRGLHLLARRDRPRVRARHRRPGPGRRARSSSCSTRSARRPSATRSCEVLEGGGCQLAWFNPIGWYTLDRFNYRTHRKSLIVDGRIAFTGGAGIADHWRGRAQDPEHWRDMQVRVEGPGAVPLQTGFAQNWLRTTGEMVTGADVLSGARAGRRGDRAHGAQLAVGRRLADADALLPVDRLGADARSCIANPYFVPDQVAIDALRRRQGPRRRRHRSSSRASATTTGWRATTASACSARCSKAGDRDLRVQPHDAAPEDDGGRRRVGDDRHRQLRQPLVRLQRGEQRLGPRPRRRAAPRGDLRRGSGGERARDARGLAAAAAWSPGRRSWSPSLFEDQV